MHSLELKSDESKFLQNLFFGIVINNDSANGRSGGIAQYRAHCNYTRVRPKIDATKSAMCHFVIGSEKSVGVAVISFPLGPITLKFYVQVVGADVPTVMGTYDMDRNSSYLDNLSNILVFKRSGSTSKNTRTCGPPIRSVE